MRGVCSEGHLLKENARSFGCPECRRNETRRRQYAERPERIALKMLDPTIIYDVVPRSQVRILARAYLTLLREKQA